VLPRKRRRRRNDYLEADLKLEEKYEPAFLAVSLSSFLEA